MVEVNGKMVPDYAADGKGAKDLRKNMRKGGEAKSDRQMLADSDPEKGGKMPSDQDMKMIRRYLEERGITTKDFMDRFKAKS